MSVLRLLHPAALYSALRRQSPRRRVLVVAIVAAAVGGATLDAWLFTCGFDGCPSAAEMRAFKPSEGGRVLDRNGRLIGRMNPVRRVNVPLARVPDHVRNAFIATEDRRFQSHDGVDWRGAARALVRNVRAADVREGFSTITMQLARNTFLAHRAPSGSRSFGRKLLEMRVARLLERTLSKDQILEHYLNAIYLGNGVYGVEGASRDLFGHGVRDVSIAEGAMLAALPKGPSAYTPRRDHDRALERRNLVLGLMQREGYLDDIGVAAARAEDLQVMEDSWRPSTPDDSYALDLVRAVVDSVLQPSRRGAAMSDVTVYTTLDLLAQRAAERAVRHGANAIAEETGDYWAIGDGDGDADTRRDTRLEGAMVAMDPRTGDIRALVGGRTYNRGAFNRALSARRQPGSAFKPFVYAAALSSGFTPASLVDDEPVSVDLGRDTWTPANFGDEYQGRVTFREALVHSSNAAAVRVSRTVGERRVVDVAHRNGIRSPLSAVPAIALGAAEVTPLELVTAYTPFANGGFHVEPRIVRRIERGNGTAVWERAVSREPVMDPRDAWQLTSMLRSVVDRGTGRAVRNAGITGPVAGKTGTTNSGNDVWFVGYTPTLVAGFWFGYDTPRSLGSDASGGRLAAPAWAQFYREGWRERGSERAWAPPTGMEMREVDPDTGDLAGEYCPRRQREWFKPGTAPTSPCQQHTENPDAWIAALQEEIPRRAREVLKRLLRNY